MRRSIGLLVVPSARSSQPSTDEAETHTAQNHSTLLPSLSDFLKTCLVEQESRLRLSISLPVQGWILDAFMMSTLYQVHPLPLNSKSTRVLDILPVPSSVPHPDDEPIKCNLRVIDLDDRPDFTALSYVWGAPVPKPHSIICDETTVNITSNCHSALRHLRKKFGKVTIWVDAVAINQHDEDEKLHQIPLMGDIYSNAASVYVWLGDGTSGTDRAMWFMATSSFDKYHTIAASGKRRSRPFAAAWSLWSARWSRTRHPFPFTQAPHDGLTAKMLRSVMRGSFPEIDNTGKYTTLQDVHDLLSKEWICRLWTYQEILLASNPIVVCGDKHVIWARFERSILFLKIISTLDMQEATEPWASLVYSREQLQTPKINSLMPTTSALREFSLFVTETYQAAFTIESFMALCSILGAAVMLYLRVLTKISLLIVPYFLFLVVWMIFLLQAMDIHHRLTLMYVPKAMTQEFAHGLYSRRAKKPRDMAFGMWAVLQRGGAINLPLPSDLHDIGSVYWTLAIHLIQTTNSLATLLIAAARACPNKPSWVPDWSANTQHGWSRSLWGLQSTDKHGKNIIAQRHSSEYQTTTVSEPTKYFRFDETQTIIHVRAYYVGDISTCAHFQETDPESTLSQRDAHINNFRSILALWTTDGYPCRRAYEDILILCGLGARSMGVFEKYVRLTDKKYPEWRAICKWPGFLMYQQGRDPSEILDHLESQQHLTYGNWFKLTRGHVQSRDILSTHIAICNFFAQSKRILSRVQLHSEPGTPTVLGLCSQNAQVGDQIVRVEGVPQLLVVRPCTGAGNSVKIVSPVVLQTRSKSVWSRITRKQTEPLYVEYNIH
ncbi:hypothetical protein P153DRAFT_397162 [Dothidotthia symphoricarpi CBS 119687]|uniref:Heterokaryon incompatibility domain-containing protein n=1 Tax=Dothidotthia symphoricarpi CBS 119687 TaxID=1392245 RepID=A0A6A6AAV3_9PLEO|nr:uncharacterized protein P153DRAFT_397162 [Dothidotthia symphoricarpi CBS 119687]KAF2128950.1 hypothetical protein P153DRAFT_397162 [Dothidotthia symphoricarpi CBS 119687]